MRWVMIVAALGLAGCETTTTTSTPTSTTPVVVPQSKGKTFGPGQAMASFASIQRRIEPVAEKMCRQRTKGLNCDFKIVVDRRAGQPSNAYQSLDKSGRPIITFTTKLINETHNTHELAFVMGHEAAHHIQGHLARQGQNAAVGAVLLGGIAALAGVGGSGISAAQDIGATVGARSFSKNHELEADQLGTVITHAAGYNPLVGARFFSRIPDPGNRFLGSHPPNSQRYQTVVNTSRRIGLIQ